MKTNQQGKSIRLEIWGLLVDQQQSQIAEVFLFVVVFAKLHYTCSRSIVGTQ